MNQMFCQKFDDEVLREMEIFKRNFLENNYKKEISENQGPNYREKILVEDQRAFEDYLEDSDFQELLNLK